MKVTPIRKKFGRYAPGDVFELPDRSARLLIKVGKLQAVDEGAEAPAPVEPVVPVEVVASISPEDVGQVVEQTVAPRQKRTYQRRDMQAEGAPRRAPAKKATAKRATRKTSQE